MGQADEIPLYGPLGNRVTGSLQFFLKDTCSHSRSTPRELFEQFPLSGKGRVFVGARHEELEQRIFSKFRQTRSVGNFYP